MLFQPYGRAPAIDFEYRLRVLIASSAAGTHSIVIGNMDDPVATGRGRGIPQPFIGRFVRFLDWQGPGVPASCAGYRAGNKSVDHSDYFVGLVDVSCRG
jgi:hypothetical protein